MFFNLFTIIILCIQANKVNTNIFETTNHSIRSTMRVIKICERQNMALFKKKIIVSSSYDFSSSHTTVFLNSSMRETNRCETHEDYRQWCNLFNNTMYLCLCRTTLALPVYSNTLHTSRDHKISNDSPMTSCVPDI